MTFDEFKSNVQKQFPGIEWEFSEYPGCFDAVHIPHTIAWISGNPGVWTIEKCVTYYGEGSTFDGAIENQKQVFLAEQQEWESKS